jgi:hypothetical protein
MAPRRLSNINRKAKDLNEAALHGEGDVGAAMRSSTMAGNFFSN